MVASFKDCLGQLPPEELAFNNLPAYIALQDSSYRFAVHNLLLMDALMRVESGEITRLVVAAPPRHGKLIADSIPVLTPAGWRKHGDIRVGDFVFGPDGKPTKVLFRSDSNICDIDVEMTNGEIIKVHSGHLWTVYDRRAHRPEIKTLETQELALDLWIGDRNKRGGRARWQLPDIQAVEYPSVQLQVHPYVLGAWLGDGSSDQSRLAHDTRDREVIYGIEQCGYETCRKYVQEKTGVGYATFGRKLTQDLRTINVFKNKHIPEMYLRSDINQRLELLAGLIDTDGSVEPNTGRVRFSTCSEALRDGVFDLTSGLGFRPYIISVQPSTSSSGIVGKKNVYQVCFQPTMDIPTKIPRKKICCFSIRRKVAIKDIRPAEKPEIGHCIKVDREDGLYLVGKQLVVTHNTRIIGELFPAWYIGRNPTHQIIYATYAYDRAADVGRKIRNQMLDRAYQRTFRESPLAMDSRGVNKLSTESGGNFFAVGVSGILTGRGAHLLVIDDPHKGRKEVESETQRNQVIDWFKSVAYTRLMPGGRVVVLATRWHFSDLTGFILEELKHENWHYLRLPAICDTADDILNRNLGDPLWATDYPAHVLERIKETIGSREWNAQYQQNPLPASGGMVKLEWFQRYDWGPWAACEFVLKTNPTAHINRENIPYGIRRIVISIDTAFKEDQINDPSAFTIWGITSDYKFYLLNIVNERFDYPKLKKIAAALWNKYSRLMTGLPVVMIVEDKASGQSLIQDFKTSTTFPIVAIPATVSKQIRMSTASPHIESGKVFLPERAPWVPAYETQISRFPLWKEDDLVDSTSQFLNWVSQPQYVKTGQKHWK